MLASTLTESTAANELPPGRVADLGAWTLVLLGFAVVTLGLWAVLHYTGRSSADAPEDRESVDASQGAS